MEGAGSWDTIEWTKVDVSRPGHGMEEFLLEEEEVIVQGHGVVLLNTDEAGTLSVTNFRLLFVSQATKGIIELGTIPLATIEKFTDDVKLPSLPRQSDRKPPGEFIQVIGKDMRIIMFGFLPKTEQRNEVLDALRGYTKPAQLWDLYAFSSNASKFKKNTNPKIRLLKEYCRLFRKRSPNVPNSTIEVESLSLSNNWWRLTSVNSSYALCPTYPSALIVPKSISDEELLHAASFRAGRRLPAVSWCDPGSGAVLARSSQPFVGFMISFRNDTDEKLVRALRTQTTDANGSPRKFYIVDARPRANALANGAKGGGSESSSNYFKSEVLFLGIQNIHAMRDSFSRLREYVDMHGTTSSNGTSSYLRNRGSTWGGGNLSSMSSFSSMLGEGGWLNHIQNVLVGASWIAARIALESASVLVHCSDGWDRTTQLVSLACLLLDPYYRTFSGFQALVEKDWLAFGHPFAERMGIPTIPESTGTHFELSRQASLGNLTNSPNRMSSGSLGLPPSSTSSQSQTSNNSSPILLQWLDCVSQLIRLYPCAFQFSSKFLVDFMDCVLSCRFGNFLCNSEKEREQSGVTDSCHCLWVHLADLRGSGGSFHDHCNPFYDPEKYGGPLLPPAAALAPTIWPQYHLRWTCPSESQGGELDSQWRAMNRKYMEVLKEKEIAESRARDLKMKMESLATHLQKEKHVSNSALAMARSVRRESAAIKRAIQSLGCKVNFSSSGNQTMDTGTISVDKTEGLSCSIRRDTDIGCQQDEKADLSVSISAIEDGLVSETPSDQLCETLCPFRTREGCRWPDAGCAQLGSQFVGLKANFDAVDRLSIHDAYFGSE